MRVDTKDIIDHLEKICFDLEKETRLMFRRNRRLEEKNKIKISAHRETIIFLKKLEEHNKE